MIEQLKAVPSWASATALFPLSETFFLDVKWWTHFIRQANGKPLSKICKVRQEKHAFTDACVTGYSAVVDHDGPLCQWYACSWTENEESLARRQKRDSMPWKELHAVARAVATFGSFWQGCRVHVHTDCESVIKAWKKGDSRKTEMAALVRTLLFMCAVYDLELHLDFIAGVDNVRADLLSRGQIVCFKEFHPLHDPSPTTCLPLPIQVW
jgi:hypothetical protein